MARGTHGTEREPPSGARPRRGLEAEKASLEAALAKAAAWLERDGIEGVAQGEIHGEPCILVLASRPAGELGERVPTRLDGFPVMIRWSGPGGGGSAGGVH